MRADAFRVPVVVEWGRVGLYRHVGSVREAAEIITSDDWPEAGPEAIAAAQALSDAREGDGSAEAARAAFERAAKAAGILRERVGRPKPQDVLKTKRPAWARRYRKRSS